MAGWVDIRGPIVTLSRDKKDSLSRCPFVPGQKKVSLSHCPFVTGKEQQQKSQDKILCPGTSQDKTNVKKRSKIVNCFFQIL